MDDFLLRFATCSTHSVVSTCAFQRYAKASFLSIGMLASALIGAPAEYIVFIIGVIVRITSTTMLQQYAVGVGALGAAVPMYQTETAPSQIHGTLTCVVHDLYSKRLVDCISTGTKYIPDSVSWRIPVGIGILWVLILGISILFMPESPRMFSAHTYPARTRGLSSTEAKDHYITRHEAPLICGGIWQSAWLSVFASGGTVVEPVTHPDTGKRAWHLTVCMSSGIWILIGETFSTCARAKKAVSRRPPTGLKLVIGMTFLRVRYLWCTYVFLYESSDISLENVDMCTPWTSRQWAPPGHLSRRDALEPTRSAEERKQGGGSQEGMIERQRPVDV
ncbi:hypothetical protein V8E55_010547 [Tylopilus felleus]